MLTNDFPRFQAVMATLSITYGKELSPALTDVYWAALQGVFIEQVEQAGRSCIRMHKHWPKPADILQFIRDNQASSQGRSTYVPPPPKDRKWLAHVNGFFLQYLCQRRITEEFKGDINLEERRAECLRLVDFFEALEADADPEATPEEMQKRLTAIMASVPDAEAA